jgi:hypothetical protein
MKSSRRSAVISRSSRRKGVARAHGTLNTNPSLSTSAPSAKPCTPCICADAYTDELDLTLCRLLKSNQTACCAYISSTLAMQAVHSSILHRLNGYQALGRKRLGQWPPFSSHHNSTHIAACQPAASSPTLRITANMRNPDIMCKNTSTKNRNSKCTKHRNSLCSRIPRILQWFQKCEGFSASRIPPLHGTCACVETPRQHVPPHSRVSAPQKHLLSHCFHVISLYMHAACCSASR